MSYHIYKKNISAKSKITKILSSEENQIGKSLVMA